MRIDLEKTHHFTSIGTFILTAFILVATVWPLLPRAEGDAVKSGDKQEQSQPISPPARHPVTAWILPGLLGLAIVGAAVINLKAARLRTRKGVAENPDAEISDAVRGMLESRAETINTQNQELDGLREDAKVFQDELNRLPALTIHSAVYGAGHIGREDLPVSPDKLRSRNALAMRIENHALVPRDPASGKRKRLIVRYSFETADVREATFWEGGLMILPEQPADVYDLTILSVYESINKPNNESGTPLLVQVGNNTGDFVKRTTASIDFVALDNQDDSFRIPEACWLPSSNGVPMSITANVDIGPRLYQPLVLCTVDTDSRKVLPRRGNYGITPYFLSEGRWRATVTVTSGVEVILIADILFRVLPDGRVIDIKY